MQTAKVGDEIDEYQNPRSENNDCIEECIDRTTEDGNDRKCQCRLFGVWRLTSEFVHEVKHSVDTETGDEQLFGRFVLVYPYSCEDGRIDVVDKPECTQHNECHTDNEYNASYFTELSCINRQRPVKCVKWGIMPCKCCKPCHGSTHSNEPPRPVGKLDAVERLFCQVRYQEGKCTEYKLIG